MDKYIFKFAPVVIVSCILMFRIKNISYCYSVTFLVMVALLQNGYCKPSAQLKGSKCITFLAAWIKLIFNFDFQSLAVM